MTNDRAPSWSWLSMDCSISWQKATMGRGPKELLCSIQHVTVLQSETRNAVIYLKAEMTLRGTLCKILSIRDLYPGGFAGVFNRSFGSMELGINVEGFEGFEATGAFLMPDYWIEGECLSSIELESAPSILITTSPLSRNDEDRQ